MLALETSIRGPNIMLGQGGLLKEIRVAPRPTVVTGSTIHMHTRAKISAENIEDPQFIDG